MNRFRLRFTLPTVILLFILTSCAENLPQNISTNYDAPYQHTFSVSYKDAWRGVIRTLNEKDRIKTIDKESGLVVTEYMTVNKRVLTMFQTALFGRTYKNSYSVTLTESGPGRTHIAIQSNLMMEQFGFYNRERDVAWFEAYLREDLFHRLCNTYYQNQDRCRQTFNDTQRHLAQYSNQPPPTENKHDNTDIATIEVQKALVDAGYNPGPIDGVWGTKTRNALVQFQKDQGLYSSGTVDPSTLNALRL